MPDVAQLMATPRAESLPDFSEGDTVRVHVRVVEGSRERLQVFEGVVIATHRPKSPEGTFTVRRIASHSVGVERTDAGVGRRHHGAGPASCPCLRQRQQQQRRRPWPPAPRSDGAP